MALILEVPASNVCSILLIALYVVDKIHTSTGVVYGGLLVLGITIVVLQYVVGFL